MRVRANLNLGTNDYPVQYAKLAGEEFDVPEKIGKTMVDRKHAIDITPPPKVEAPKATAEAPKEESKPKTAPVKQAGRSTTATTQQTAIRN
jgi:hypothetical protein